MRRLSHVLILLLAMPAAGFAQNGRPEVIHDSHHEVTPPLRDMQPGPRENGVLEAEPVRRIPSSRIPHDGPDPVLQRAPVGGTGQATLAAPATITNFDGVGQGFTGPSGTFAVNSAPPDTNAAVGPNHIVQIVNTDLAVFNKSGTPLFGPVPINTFWQAFTTTDRCKSTNDGDPIVTYDRIADRWIVSQFQVTFTPFEQCLAVSRTSDPTGSYNVYSFPYTDGFPDYPKMGVWPDAYYITYNLFNNAGTAFLGTKVCAFDRASMLAGVGATQVCFNTSNSFGGLLPGDVDGSALPAAGAPNPLVALGATSTTLALWKFHVDFATPANSTFSGPTALTVPAYAEACNGGTCIPQAGSSTRLDSLADRLMYRAAYRNFGDHESIVVNHSVTVGTSSGLRWYELRGVTTTPTLFQAGTFAPDASFRWMGSAAMDQSGNMAIGYSRSSTTTNPQILITGRLAADAAGTLTQGETLVMSSGGAQSGTLTRWGDYSSMAIDPVDNCTFYYTTEYIPSTGSFNWKTRIASFKLPSCGGADFAVSASPASVSVAQGGSGSSTISVAPSGGFTGDVALTISGLPNGASASFTPTPVTIAGTSAVTSTLSLIAGTAAAGSYPLIVTATSGTLTHTAAVTLVVTAPDFSLSASPASVTIVQGNSGTSTISVVPIAGFAGSVSLSASGQPTGVNTSFSPTAADPNTPSVLTITVSSTAAIGTSTLTVTGTSGSLTHAVGVTLRITGPADFSLTASPGTVNVPQGGGTGTSTIGVTPVNGFNGPVTLSVTAGLPPGATASFGTNPTSSTSVLTLTVDSTVATGSYSLTITGTSGSLSHFVTVTLAVNPPGFTLTANPASLTVQHGKSGTDTIAISRSAGFTGAVALSVSGLPAGVTATFNPQPATGASSTLTINASGNAQRSTFTLTITGTSSGVPTATTTLALTIR